MRPVRIIKSKALGFFTQVSGVHDSCKETGIMRIKKNHRRKKTPSTPPQLKAGSTTPSITYTEVIPSDIITGYRCIL